MNILLVNTSEREGGAAIAASRLCEALGNNGVKAKMLVARKTSGNISVADAGQHLRMQSNFVRERLTILAANKFHKYRLFETDAAKYGLDITGLDEFREADLIHLHWINQGLLSIGGIAKILRSGKPVVWTMHDMWPFTGICHTTLGCERFKAECGQCPMLYGGGSPHDLSHQTFLRKQKLYSSPATAPITFVACSNWLAGCARSSALLGGRRVESIPNPINSKLYAPRPRAATRRALALPQGKTLLLFAAYRITNKNKGFDYLCEAIRLLADKHPDIASSLALVAVGRESEALKPLLPIEVCSMGYVSNENTMIDIYNACNMFLIPTLQDNLPNTVMEAMACGVPCVAFNVGGIPQMINHREDGYIAEYKSAADFAAGIMWCLDPQNAATLPEKARAKVCAAFSETAVTRKYSDLYKSLLGGRDE